MSNSRSARSLPRRPHAGHWLAALLLCFFAPQAGAAIFTVGAPGSGCSHQTIPAAIAAAEANPGADTIRITRSQTHTLLQLELTTAQDLSIVGGFATCTQTVSDGQKTVLSGAGGVNAPVLLLRGNSPSRIRLRLLRLTGGDSTVAGGGVNYVGSGELELIEMAIDGNTAPNGGGIYFAGNGTGPSSLTISNDNLISGNQATAGGGIYLVNAGMTMNAPGSSIAFNSAQVGGGLYVYGAENGTGATVGSGGFPGIATIYANQAAVGGGVAVHAPNVNGITRGSFTMETIDAARPASISNNFASQRGGAIDLKPYSGTSAVGDVSATVFGGWLDANIAPVAAAVYLGNFDSLLTRRGSLFQIDSGRIVNHSSEDEGSIPTDGALLVATEETQLYVSRTRFEGNTAGRIVRAGTAKRVELRSSLLTDNTVQDTVLSIDGTGLLGFEVSGTTIAGNSIGGDAVIYARGTTALGDSIIWQPGRVTLDAVGAVVDDVLASEIASLGGGDTVVSAPPRFIDPGRGDYRLQAASRAVDFSAALGVSAIDGVGRGIDLERVANFNGPSDLGAYERPQLGNLALNPGFVEDLRLWQSGTPGSSATWSAAIGSDQGSVALSMTSAPGGNFVGLRQCVRIPGPGFYRLTGLGYGSGADALTRDDVSLRWQLRNNSGGEECVGAIDAEGVVDFGNGATWQQPVAPGLIDVGAALWTRSTNVEILLQVREGSFNINATTTGFFDLIRLEAVDGVSGLPFADGFEQ